MRFWWRQFFSDRKAPRLALNETFFVCAISLIPLFGLALIDHFQTDFTHLTSLFWDAISAGQLFLYSFSLFGTLFWLCQKEHENFARFEPRLYLMFLIFVPCVLIIIIYALNPTMSRPIKPTMVWASFAIYILYVAMYYVLLVFDNLEPPPVEEGLQEDAASLMDEYHRVEGKS